MTGYAWQRALDVQHDRYMAAGRAFIVRTSPPTAGGRFIRKGPPDYIVLLRAHALLHGHTPLRGHTLVMDAKCYRDGFTLADLPDHQAAAFHNVGVLGHRGGLIFPGEVCWWADFGPAWLRWRNEGGENLRVRGDAFNGTDWLSTVENI